MSIIHIVDHILRALDNLSNAIQVIQRDQQHVRRASRQLQLVLYGHSHQIEQFVHANALVKMFP